VAITISAREKFRNTLERFKGRRASVADDECSGCPSAVKSVEVNKQMDQRIRDKPRISIDKTVSEIIIVK
jgi:hypothetical protein